MYGSSDDLDEFDGGIIAESMDKWLALRTLTYVGADNMLTKS